MKTKNLFLTILIAASSGSFAYSIEPSSQQEQPRKKLQAQTRRQQLVKILKVLVPVVGVSTATSLAMIWYSKTNTPPAKVNDSRLTDQAAPQVEAALKQQKVVLPVVAQMTPLPPRPARAQFFPEISSGGSDKSKPEGPTDKDSSGTSENKESVWPAEKGTDPYPEARQVYNAAQRARKKREDPKKIIAIYAPGWNGTDTLSENDLYKSRRNLLFHADRMPEDPALAKLIREDWEDLLKQTKVKTPRRHRRINYDLNRVNL
jgi:hypothetical protein